MSPDHDSLSKLGAALQSDPGLAAALSRADSAEQAATVAAGFGIELSVDEVATILTSSATELSDSELATASGGYTFPPTDWVYCDNPWTNYWCTLKC